MTLLPRQCIVIGNPIEQERRGGDSTYHSRLSLDRSELANPFPVGPPLRPPQLVLQTRPSPRRRRGSRWLCTLVIRGRPRWFYEMATPCQVGQQSSSSSTGVNRPTRARMLFHTTTHRSLVTSHPVHRMLTWTISKHGCPACTSDAAVVVAGVDGQSICVLPPLTIDV
jgi:hypothetical protein